jgi:hypothetical protein
MCTPLKLLSLVTQKRRWWFVVKINLKRRGYKNLICPQVASCYYTLEYLCFNSMLGSAICPCEIICVNVRVIKTNLMHYLSSVYFVNQPLHVLGIFVAHHQEVYCTQQFHPNPANRQSTKTHNTYQLLYSYIYSIPPDDGLQIYPKHVEVD